MHDGVTQSRPNTQLMGSADCICLIFDKVFQIIFQSHNDNKAILSKTRYFLKNEILQILDNMNYAIVQICYSKQVMAGRERSQE